MYNKKMNLFSKVNIKILSLLARTESRIYGRELAGKTGISIGATNQSLNFLFNEGFLKREKKGGAYFYWADKEKPAIIQFKIFISALELGPLIEAMKNKTEKIILFGSCADGTDNEKSDIDLLIITQEKETVKKEIEHFQTQRPIQAIIKNHSEWLESKNMEKPFYDRVNNGITLWRQEHV